MMQVKDHCKPFCLFYLPIPILTDKCLIGINTSYRTHTHRMNRPRILRRPLYRTYISIIIKNTRINRAVDLLRSAYLFIFLLLRFDPAVILDQELRNRFIKHRIFCQTNGIVQNNLNIFDRLLIILLQQAMYLIMNQFRIILQSQYPHYHNHKRRHHYLKSKYLTPYTDKFPLHILSPFPVTFQSI